MTQSDPKNPPKNPGPPVYYTLKKLSRFQWQILEFNTKTLKERPIGEPNLLSVVEGKVAELMKARWL